MFLLWACLISEMEFLVHYMYKNFLTFALREFSAQGVRLHLVSSSAVVGSDSHGGCKALRRAEDASARAPCAHVGVLPQRGLPQAPGEGPAFAFPPRHGAFVGKWLRFPVWGPSRVRTRVLLRHSAGVLPCQPALCRPWGHPIRDGGQSHILKRGAGRGVSGAHACSPSHGHPAAHPPPLHPSSLLPECSRDLTLPSTGSPHLGAPCLAALPPPP